ncbi:glycosyltransferase [Labilibaculum sp. A4]|uniref:glycosyltransferase family 2 protein n=1 Tax=Labilibaculum euxinus TaxID=2686357 RepID=UPI000F626FE0|nr:glycosyltransferase family 2 protein [Labilibaculum euxinus]MDQ1772722.1 glycosyltransferase family 2 protein [Labilibaculum euxinus]MWN78320.1 glycosyltransferase [Labilibaculum euxinus]
MNQPLVSIITPTYNSERFLCETIDSILNQTYENWELLVTDDCSTDSTWVILENYARCDCRIKIFRLSKNRGAGIARNSSIEKAIGRYIAFCDSDDQWTSVKLEKQVQFMFENNYALSFSSYRIIDEVGTSLGFVKAKHTVDYKTMLKNNYIGCLTAIYDVKQLGKFFMPEIRKRQDWALWLSILKKNEYAYGINESLAIYRDRRDSISANKFSLIKYNWAIYRNVEKFSLVLSTFLLFQFIFYYVVKKRMRCCLK